MGDMIEVFNNTSNIYNRKVTKFLTYRDHIVTQGSQRKKSTSFFVVIVFATTFFNPHLQQFQFTASGCGRSKQFEYLQKQTG